MVIPELNKLKHTLSFESMESACLPTVTEDLLASIDRRWPGMKQNLSTPSPLSSTHDTKTAASMTKVLLHTPATSF